MDDELSQIETLYRETAPALLAYFRHQPALAGAAEDLLHDTFAHALRQLGRLRESITPRAYLFGIARHVGLDAFRKRHPAAELPAEFPAPPVTPEDERLEPLRAALAALPEPHRETLLLKLRHDLTYAELAEVLAIPVGTVRSRLHHAVSLLRTTLNPPPHES